MTPAEITAEPLAVWDTHDYGDSLYSQHIVECSNWANEHIRDCKFTYRAEFYLADAPFVVLYRYKRNDGGYCYLDPATGDTAVAEPVAQMLDELPPDHLLGR